MKFSSLLINEKNDLRIKIMDGQFFIESFTMAHYSASRIAKGYRAKKEGKDELSKTIGVDLKKGDTEIGIMPERILKPFTMVLSDDFSDLLTEYEAQFEINKFVPKSSTSPS